MKNFNRTHDELVDKIKTNPDKQYVLIEYEMKPYNLGFVGVAFYATPRINSYDELCWAVYYASYALNPEKLRPKDDK